MRRAALSVLALAAGCAGQSAKPPISGPDGGAVFGDAAAGPLSIVLTPAMDASPVYPWDPTTGDHRVTLRYRVTVQNRGPELQDLEVQLTAPMPSPEVTVSGGWYNGIQKLARRTIDWLPAEQGPLVIDVAFKKAIQNPFNLDDPNALRGDVTLETTGRIVQYDQVLASSGTVSTMGYFPQRVTAQDLDFYSGQVDGEFLYLSARPRSGDQNGKAGIYRVALADGTVSVVAQHQARSDLLPFVIDGASLYYVTYTIDGMPTSLMKKAKDGSGDAVPIPVPAHTELRAVAADDKHLYVTLRPGNGPYALYRCAKGDPAQDTRTSEPLGTVIEDTIALTSTRVVLLTEDGGKLLSIAKSDFAITPLEDVGSTAGRRTLACDETSCFWTEWSAGGIFQTSLASGGKKKISGSNQPFHYDGAFLYSGINGLIRVGGDGRHPEQRLFGSGVVPVLGGDARYVYFGYDNRVWRLHK